MAKIEGFKVKNFKALKNVTLGRLWDQKNVMPLSDMAVVIGKNGVGKSSLFDAFGFLADALKTGLEEACDSRGRGGFERIRTKGQTEPIEFEIYYREDKGARPITYEISIDADASGRPYVLKERLRQRRAGQSRGRPFSFLRLEKGAGVVWRGNNSSASENEEENDLINLMGHIKSQKNKLETPDTELIELSDDRRLGIATLGTLKQHPRISSFRKFIESWYLSYFTPDSARSLPMAGPQKHLNMHGDNLGNVVQFMEREQPKRFKNILNQIAQKIPGMQTISTEKMQDGRLLLKFNNKGFKEPFYAQEMSDGTLKLFTYLLLLNDPSPAPFLCIEEPENGLYHKLLASLVNEFREHATGRKNGSQIFITTHQPYLVDALSPEEVWVLKKGSDGCSTIERASDNPLVKNMVEEGLPLGGLWFSDYLDAEK